MIKRRYFRTAISVFLLICFSAVTLPIDFLHNHTEEQVVCKDASTTGACSHKLHLSKKNASCWLCAFHIDKSFGSPNVHRDSREPVIVRILTENRVIGFVFHRLITQLRGPPTI